MGNSAPSKSSKKENRAIVLEPCSSCGEELHRGMRCEPMTGWIYRNLCTTCVIGTRIQLASGTHRGADALYIATCYPTYRGSDCNPIEENLIHYIRKIYELNYDNSGEKKLNFGKYSKRVYSHVVQGDPLYVSWCRKQEDPPIEMQLFLNYADLYKRKSEG